ncbi:MAG TPA: Fe-S cluster assembly protein SufD [Pyrinomonadaceae bacterium]|nr:Fe-S cluster assembly protein SufD [Pyrinomonadaceae bacterium]
MSSTTAVTETVFTKQFAEFRASIGDDAMTKLRSEAFAYFEATGFPTPKDEDWKYTNVAAVAGGQWTVDSAGASGNTGEFNYKRNGFTALNLAFADIVVVRIPSETIVVEPIELSFTAEDGKAIFPHVIVVAESGSKATIVETYAASGRGFTNAAVQVLVEENANLTHYRVQKDSVEAFNYGVTEVEVRSGGHYDSTNINLGAALSRHDIDLKFVAEGAEAWVDGLYMLSGGQHHDTHSIIDHTVPNCLSHQTYKGVLNENSRGVFNGKVFVRENAHGTDAQQSNKNLLLSNEARVDTKPQLEIFNDDVKCSHGATVGQLEDEELFYLLTRGLPKTLAKNLLTYGFAEEVINKIEIESIKGELDSMVLNRLGAEI